MLKYLLAFFVAFCFFSGNKILASEVYDEVPVTVEVKGLAKVEMIVVIKNEELYLPITDLFDFLRINNTASSEYMIISGFFLQKDNTYYFDREKKTIDFKNQVFQIEDDDLIYTGSNVYLKSKYFGLVFELWTKFNFRSLSVDISTNVELPAIAEMRQQKMRANLTNLKGEVAADLLIPGKRSLFRLGMADWSVHSSQTFNKKNEVRLNLSMGLLLAGGEANISLNYDNNNPFNNKSLFYQWKYVDNHTKLLRQVKLGKIVTQSTSSIYGPVTGIQLTNVSSNNKSSFGTYTLNDYTEPNWIVELYINNVLVDYVKADADGFFSFDVPLLYGSSSVKLHFYGPWGEERVQEKYISIPFNFVPAGQFEYNIDAGIVEDTSGSKYSRSSFNYGMNKNITLGGGVEYLSSLNTPVISFLTTSINLGSGLIFSNELSLNTRNKSTLKYQSPKNMNLELNYIIYDKDQQAINSNYLEERKVTFFMPLVTKKVSIFSRLSANQYILPESKLSNIKLAFTGNFLRMGVNLTNNLLFSGSDSPYMFNSLAFSIRLPKRITLNPQVQYDHKEKKISVVKIGLQKQLNKNGYLNLNCEKNLVTGMFNMEVGLRFDLNFAQASLIARQINKQITLTESLRGSIQFDQDNNQLKVNSKQSVGKGGISILAYLDLNNNQVRDNNEPKVSDLNPQIKGGRFTFDKSDSIYRVGYLLPHADYLISLDKVKFEYISWQTKHKFIKVNVSPNNYTLVEVPVSVKGEVSGMVYKQKGNGVKGIAGIKVRFYNKDEKPVGHTVTEEDGYFSFLGLAPGAYTARTDIEQLNLIKLKNGQEISFSISSSIEGDFVDTLEFILTDKPEELFHPKNIFSDSGQVTPNSGSEPVKPADVIETLKDILNKYGNNFHPDLSYSIQLGAFENGSKIDFKTLGEIGEINIEKSDMTRITITGIRTLTEANKIKNIAIQKGIKDAFIIPYYKKEKIKYSFLQEIFKNN